MVNIAAWLSLRSFCRAPSLKILFAREIHGILKSRVAFFTCGNGGHTQRTRADRQVVIVGADKTNDLSEGVVLAFRTFRIHESFSRRVELRIATLANVAVRVGVNRVKTSRLIAALTGDEQSSAQAGQHLQTQAIRRLSE
jgi:hypothetical protein